MINELINISREAGEIIRDGFGKNFLVETKGSLTNLVTEIDKLSEKTIIDFIQKKYPTHSILAEESGEHNFSLASYSQEDGSEYKWIIDPLDGTTNFAHGLPIFSVSIGLQKNDELICGVVYDVMRDALYSSEKGGGSYCNGRKLFVSSNDDLRKSVLVTGFPYNISENPDNAFEHFISFLKEARAVRRLGSAAIDLCFVAEGVFDGFWEVSLNAWDMAAGVLIVNEAGGVITDFSGNKIDIYKKQLLASNGKVHSKMLEIINKK